MKTNYILILTCLLLCFACSKDQVEEEVIKPKEEEVIQEEEKQTFSVNRPDQYALEVVYFMPTDFAVEQSLLNPTLNDISDMILFMQSWYETLMDYNGFGKKTFGLVTDQHGVVKVGVIYGKESSEYYAIEANKPQVRKEVRDFLMKRPAPFSGFKLSDHMLILGPQKSKIGYFGGGTWAVAQSDDFSMHEMPGFFFNGLQLEESAKQYSGMLHELGHGLGLHHNARKASKKPLTSLMGDWGIFTYHSEPDRMIITQADCAVLDKCQIFNRTDNGIVYYKNRPNNTLKSMSISKDVTASKIVMSGSFTSDQVTPYVNVGFDFKNVDQTFPNDSYDEIFYLVSTVDEGNNKYSFSLEVEYADLFNGFQTNHKSNAEIEINAITESGFGGFGRNNKIFDGHFYTTDLATKIPNDDILYAYEAHEFTDRSNWTITANTEDVGQGFVANQAIDGDLNTYWQCQWPYKIAEKGAHEININMGEVKSIKGMYFYSKRANHQWRPKHIVVKTSTDGTSFTTSADVTINSLAEAEEVKLNFDNSTTTQHIKILVDEIYTTKTASNDQNLLFSEIDILL
ncbi:discoidin domain-containing protein [Gaetbulibacter saemankumensis]|uniref:discoidin domain-containing protein n=1 Tax=Gaetbulibacter saemankumensis TaxID=311208 RepID=UPI000425F9C7|nr:discoidin domain-containing protein [Gaetbulibacter saemankumensis]